MGNKMLAFVSAIQFLSTELSLLPVYVSRDTLTYIKEYVYADFSVM